MTTETVKIGQRLKDGWVVGGISPDTNEVFSINPLGAAEEKPVSWLVGHAKAVKLYLEGHKNPRLPSRNELTTMFNNRAHLYEANLMSNRDVVDAGGWTTDPLKKALWSSSVRKNKEMVTVVNVHNGQAFSSHKKDPNHYARIIRDEPHLKLG